MPIINQSVVYFFAPWRQRNLRDFSSDKNLDFLLISSRSFTKSQTVFRQPI